MISIADEILAITESVRDLSDRALGLSGRLAQLAEAIAAQIINDPVPAVPLWHDISVELPINARPDDPWMLAQGITDWWLRLPEEIDGITIHHVGSMGNPYTTAAYITRPRSQGGKGLPRTQYHFWIETDGTILCCLDVLYGPWHDQCGHRNSHIAIALNGALHQDQPAPAALSAAAQLSAHLMREYNIPIDNVLGHNGWARRCRGREINFTSCPGWYAVPWRQEFFAALDVFRHTDKALVDVMRSDAEVDFALDAGDGVDAGQLAELELLGIGGS